MYIWLAVIIVVELLLTTVAYAYQLFTLYFTAVTFFG